MNDSFCLFLASGLLESEFNGKIEKKCEHTKSDEELDKSHRWTKQADFEKKRIPSQPIVSK